jgi:aminoglycoside phosphotransferase (APT) family kinase protein
LLKQAPASGEAGFAENERAAYFALAETGTPRAYLPPLVSHDDGLLVFELLKDAEDLDRHLQRTGRIPVYAATALAKALASLHAIDKASLEHQDALPVRGPAWPLSLHHLTLEQYREMSWGDLGVIRQVQAHESFGWALDELAGEWSSNALIHHDVKWQNCLLVPSKPGGQAALKLIDWEFAGWGDPAWDVGSVFAAFLTAWVHSMRIDDGSAAHALPATATHPLEKMHPAIRAFWSTYGRRAGMGDAVAWFLMKSIRMSAGRLIESALAETQLNVEPNAYALLFLQLSLNILLRPQQAAGLLGLNPLD